MLELTIALVVLDSICVAFDGDETDHTGCPKGNLYWSKVGKIKPDIISGLQLWIVTIFCSFWWEM